MTILQETRLLVTLAKFHHLKQTILPSMITRVSKLLDTDLTQDQATLVDVTEHMDQMVFQDYVKRRSTALVQVVQSGILEGGIDWLNTPKPTGKLNSATTVFPADSYHRGSIIHAQGYTVAC